MKLYWILCIFSILILSSELSAQDPIISGDRGSVSMQDLGNCDCITMQPGFFGHQVFLEGKRLKKPDLLELYKPMPSVLKEYKQGYNARNMGNILLGVSVVGSIGVLAGTSNNNYWEDYSGLEKGVLLGSLATYLGGAILFTSGESKVIWSYKDYAVSTKNADDTYVVIGDQMFSPNRTRLKRKQVREIMVDFPEALKKYNKSVSTRTIGAVGMGASLVGFIAVAVIDDNGSKEWDRLSSGSKAAVIGTTAGFFASTGFLIASTFQRQKSYLMMSDECNCLVSNKIGTSKRSSYWALGMNNGGVGLSYTF